MEADLAPHGLPVLRGILDLVRPAGRIVDFKTAAQSPNPESVVHLHEVQTSAYAMLYREATGNREAELLKRLRRENKEGIVFKRLDAPYTPGRPNSGGSQLKHKFYATLSAVVSKVNAQRSVELRLLNGQGWNVVGNVAIPPSQPVPAAGAVVEVRFLYAFRESNALYQPTYLGVRRDIGQHECVMSQLKYKPHDEA